MNKVLLDTNFLINLNATKAPLHLFSKDYFEQFHKNHVVMLLSVVVMGEYCIKGKETDLPLSKSQILNYNLLHARKAAEFGAILYAAKKMKNLECDRLIINNDLKLFAQAQVEGVDYFVTADVKSREIYDILKSNNVVSYQFMDISNPATQYFKKKVLKPLHLMQAKLFDD